MNNLPQELLQQLQDKFPGLEISEKQVITVPAENLLDFMREVKENPDYSLSYLTNLTAAHYDGERCEAIYNLYSLEKGFDLMVRVILDADKPEVASLAPLWKGAIWQERETYDLMGINYTGYPDHPTRILLLDTFEGHPLRKDFKYIGGR